MKNKVFLQLPSIPRSFQFLEKPPLSTFNYLCHHCDSICALTLLLLTVSNPKLSIFPKLQTVENQKNKQHYINPFTLDNAKSKIDKYSKITNWVKLKNKQHCSKVLLNSFPTKVSLRESKGKVLLNGFQMNGHIWVLSVRNLCHPRFCSRSQRVKRINKKYLPKLKQMESMGLFA